MQISKTIEKIKEIKKETWIGDVSEDFDLIKGKYLFENNKKIVGNESENYERLSLTLKGVLKRSKEDNEGLQPKDFETYQVVNKNDLIFKLIDLNNVSTSRIGLSPYTGIVSPAYIILKSKKQILPKYAEYFYYILWVFEIFNMLGDEGVRSNLNSQDLLDLYVPVPGADEQKSIVDFLDSKCQNIDDIIEKINKQIEVLKKYKQSLITEVVTKGLDKNAEMKDSEVEWIEKIPKNWERNKVKYLFNNGKGLPITKADLVEDGVPVLSYGQIHAKTNSGVNITQDLIRCVDSYFEENYPSCAVFKNDFIFADTSEDYDGCGNCCYKRDDTKLFAGYHTIILHSKCNKDNRYYAYLFKTNCWRKQLREVATGVKLFSIPQHTIMNSTIIVPSELEQIKISDFLDKKYNKIDNILDKKSKQIEILERYKKSLIYEYVTGKKRVK